MLPPSSRPVVFDPALPGTRDGVWRAALEDGELWSPQPGPLLIVSPHPDDEVFAAGGLLRSWSERGRRVVVLSVTDGEAAHPDWAGLDLLRRQELDRAIATLCSRPVQIVRLSLPDGGVVGKMGELRGAIRSLCTGGTTLVAPFEGDGHPDHEAVGVACLEVAGDLGLAIARYPIWAWHHAQPDSFRGALWGKFALDAKALAAKCAAMSCFSSQLDPGGARPPVVPPHVLEYFKRDYEAFLL